MTTSKPVQNPLQAYWQKDLLPLLADLKLAIVLFLLIALFSISGTVIEQGQSLSFYQENYPDSPALFGFLTWKVLLTIGLDHVYRTWWFSSLLILFGSSLTACTFQRQIPSLKAAQTWSFYRQPRQFEKLALSTSIPPLSPEQWQSLPQYLQQRGYRCFEDQALDSAQTPNPHALYARKGLIGRISPIIVHISLLILIAGTMVERPRDFLPRKWFPVEKLFRFTIFLMLGPGQGPKFPKIGLCE